MVFSDLRRIPRILWRDLIMRASDSTIFFDDLMAAYFFTDTAYQYTWSKLDVHRTLLEDRVRVEAFRKAIEETVKPGDRVLDLGTGTGILAFLAAKAGAGKVIGVDSASIIDVAGKTAKKNGIGNVEFIRADLRDLDIEKVDCIICELLGMHITDEGIIYKTENALKFLKKGGRIMPERIDIYLAPVESPDAGLGFWRMLYEVDYSAVEKVPHEIRNYDMSRSKFLSQPQRIAEIDLTTEGGKNIKYSGRFRMDSDGEFHGCVMYFEAKLSKNVTLSTDPRKPQTHWKQVFLPNDQRMKVRKGDALKAEVKAVYRNTKWRWGYTLE
ncbi:MAG: methyltransferase domain-containing protein [Candidatus Altiarchaeota archaeon]